MAQCYTSGEETLNLEPWKGEEGRKVIPISELGLIFEEGNGLRPRTAFEIVLHAEVTGATAMTVDCILEMSAKLSFNYCGRTVLHRCLHVTQALQSIGPTCPRAVDA